VETGTCWRNLKKYAIMPGGVRRAGRDACKMKKCNGNPGKVTKKKRGKKKQSGGEGLYALYLGGAQKTRWVKAKIKISEKQTNGGKEQDR